MANRLANIAKLFNNALRPVSVSGSGNWFNFIKEPYSGAWQQNQELATEDLLSYHAIFACVTLISNDISKLGIKLIRKDSNKIWTETTNPAYSPVLRKPNKYQDFNQFIENWVLSILTSGNTFVLKTRDNRGVVVGLNVLDPTRVQILVSPEGEPFYELSLDNLTNVEEDNVRVPASEIIHDRMNPLYHPLVGISPIVACALSVLQGIQIQKNSAWFFKNNSRPGGILTAPGAVSQETVEQMRQQWEANYTGNNSGKVAVLADGLSYKSFDVVSAQNSQVVEQLKWTSIMVCSVFHIPPYMIGVGDTPSHNNIQSLNQQYYSQALQKRIESIESLLSEGLGLSNDLSIEFNLDDLLRMDTLTLIESEDKAVSAGIKTINESRFRMNLSPIEGGDTAYLQEQNYSLAALAKRDAKEDPFNTQSTTTNNSNNTSDEPDPEEEITRFISEFKIKSLERFSYV